MSKALFLLLVPLCAQAQRNVGFAPESVTSAREMAPVGIAGRDAPSESFSLSFSGPAPFFGFELTGFNAPPLMRTAAPQPEVLSAVPALLFEAPVYVVSQGQVPITVITAGQAGVQVIHEAQDAEQAPSFVQELTQTQQRIAETGAGAVYDNDPRGAPHDAVSEPVAVGAQEHAARPMLDRALTGAKGKKKLEKLWKWANHRAQEKGDSFLQSAEAMMTMIFDLQGLQTRSLGGWLARQLSDDDEAPAPSKSGVDMDVLRMMGYRINQAIDRLNARKGLGLPRMGVDKVFILEDLPWILQEDESGKQGRLKGLPDLRDVVAFHDQGMGNKREVYILAAFAGLADARHLAAAILHEHLAMAGLSHDEVTLLVYDITFGAFAGGPFVQLGGAVSDEELQRLAKAASNLVLEAHEHGDYIEDKIVDLNRPRTHPLSVLRHNRGVLIALAVLALLIPVFYFFLTPLIASILLGILLFFYSFSVVPFSVELSGSVWGQLRGTNFVPISFGRWTELPFDARNLKLLHVEREEGRWEAVLEAPSGWEVRMIISAPYGDGSYDLGISYIRPGDRGSVEKRVWALGQDDFADAYRNDSRAQAVRASLFERKLMPHLEKALGEAQSAKDFLEEFRRILDAKKEGADEGGEYREEADPLEALASSKRATRRISRIGSDRIQTRRFADVSTGLLWGMAFALPIVLAVASFATGVWPLAGAIATLVAAVEIVLGGIYVGGRAGDIDLGVRGDENALARYFKTFLEFLLTMLAGLTGILLVLAGIVTFALAAYWVITRMPH